LDPRHYATLRAWPYSTNYFSYIDYRKCPGSKDYEQRRPSYFVWTLRGNNTGFWFYRNFSGLHVHSVFPDTPQVSQTMESFLRSLTETLKNVAISA
jgi:hypothetical protein